MRVLFSQSSARNVPTVPWLTKHFIITKQLSSYRPQPKLCVCVCVCVEGESEGGKLVIQFNGLVLSVQFVIVLLLARRIFYGLHSCVRVNMDF
jgi:hypothetical protein